MKILGIESSCDDTAAAVAEGPYSINPNGTGSGRSDASDERVTILSNIISSQAEDFKKYGGVIPEVAARGHVLRIIPAINEALTKAKIKFSNGRPEIDAIAIAYGPGLSTSLMVGVETAKSLSYGWNLPLIAVNHIEGHIYTNFIDDGQSQDPIQFPALILTVSGGHTMLVLMRGHGRYEIIGQTRDDAAGEAFDKAAQILGLGYPGGPVISKMAEKYVPAAKDESNGAITLPRPMIASGNYEFSFSGLKTALLYQVKKDQSWKEKIPEYCHEFQKAIVDVLVAKTIKAAKELGVKTVMLSGGVSANTELRRQLAEILGKKSPGIGLHVPLPVYGTDNAAMIAAAGCFMAKKNIYTDWSKVQARPDLSLK